METVGSIEARTHLSRLLERVANGKAIARLVPALAAEPGPDVRQVLAELKAFSKGNTLGDGLTVHD